MDDPQCIKAGTYQTERGKTAHVYGWGQNMLGEWCYRGTVKGEGFCCWDRHGLALSGHDRLILSKDVDEAVVARH